MKFSPYEVQLQPRSMQVYKDVDHYLSQVNTTHVVYTCLGGFVVLFHMFSAFAKERLYIGEVVFATLFGIIVGPYGANIFTPRSWGNISDRVTNEITLEVTRIVLALGVFAIGVELPKTWIWVHRKSLLLTVVPVMAWGWFVSAGLIVALFPKLTYLSALVISACLTPTDPILAAAVVGGHYADKNVPVHIRRLIAAESAANDGLAYPFLFIALYLTLDATVGEAMKDFFTVAILYQVVLGVVIGSILGYSFSKTMQLAESRGYIGTESYVVQFVALSLFTIGVVTMIGSDDLLAAFAAGTALSWDGHMNKRTEEHAVFASILEVILNCAIFVFIGAWIRFSDMTIPELHVSPGRLTAFFFSILFVRRIPPILMIWKIVPDIHTWQEALFCGWFGPMGVGAVFISTLALTVLPEAGTNPGSQTDILARTMQPIVAFTILGSILVHGLSIPAFSVAKRINTISRSLTTPLTDRGGGGHLPEWMNQVHVDGRSGSISSFAAAANSVNFPPASLDPISVPVRSAVPSTSHGFTALGENLGLQTPTIATNTENDLGKATTSSPRSVAFDINPPIAGPTRRVGTGSRLASMESVPTVGGNATRGE